MSYGPAKTSYPTGYNSAPAQGDPRRTESWALIESARRMAEAARADTSAMRDALRLNWRLWTILQAELIGTGENLPSDLRSNMLSLAQFVDQHTLAILAFPEPEKMDVLIKINRNIAAGLSAEIAAPADAPSAGLQQASVAQSA